MIRETLSAARDLGRLHEIAMVLIRWGFGDMVRRLGMSNALEKAGRVLHWKDAELLAELEPPQRVCKALEELGPTFVKLGQMLATRVDMFSPEWISAFEKLQDQVPAASFEDLLPQLQEDLGCDPEDLFDEFTHEPFAAASIAQVHLARLKSGEQVVLKIRRPKIGRQVDADLRLLKRLAEIASSSYPELRRYDPEEIVRQFSLSLRRELDLEGECRHAERIAENLQAYPEIIIPKVYWQWTCTRLNVQEYLDGVRASDFKRLDASGINKKKVAFSGSQAVMHMVLVNGFFHADPHLGNIICMSDDKLGLIDFGMVGRLTERRREEIIRLLYGLVKKNTADVIEVLLDWVPNSQVNEDALSLEIDNFLDHYHGRTLKQLNFSALLTDLTSILREHELKLPPDLALLFKTLISLDGVGRRLDPDFNIVEVASPFLLRIIQRQHRPDVLLKQGFDQTSELLQVIASLPKDVKSLLKSIRRGGFQINVDMTRLDHFGHQMDRAASRVTIGLVIAALIVGTAIVSSIENQPTLFGMPAWGFIGFIFAALWGVALLISIWRGNKDL